MTRDRFAPDGSLLLEPIGWTRSELRQKADARRQGALDESGSIATIEFVPGKGFERALRDLEGFDRAWVLYGFHLSVGWRPTVMPPRGPHRKRGIFATRSPYRPNPIGLSCVRLLSIDGLSVSILEHDLLDGTPVYDLKPYVASADAFPEARLGWLEGLEEQAFPVEFSPRAHEQLEWLERNGVPRLREVLRGLLENEPLDKKRKRVRTGKDGGATLAYRTWRADFSLVASPARRVIVNAVRTGYSPRELASEEDPIGDLNLHRCFEQQLFGGSSASSDAPASEAYLTALRAEADFATP